MRAMEESFEALRQKMLAFRNQRDWEQFHDPKNLAEGLSVEAAELLEHFLWKTAAESRTLTPGEIHKVGEEIADVFMFVVYLCEALHLDLFEAVTHKLALNEKKYPVDKARGSKKKYTDL
jgi:dCTP diphosphatase